MHTEKATGQVFFFYKRNIHIPLLHKHLVLTGVEAPHHQGAAARGSSTVHPGDPRKVEKGNRKEASRASSWWRRDRYPEKGNGEHSVCSAGGELRPPATIPADINSLSLSLSLSPSPSRSERDVSTHEQSRELLGSSEAAQLCEPKQRTRPTRGSKSIGTYM
uniref:Uncharacterized protein n=1 Tax=Oryza sativa subsp. indica TaxID=39946 RepID=A0A679BCF3_ORYSI|nr:hypothetical protein [Oryza sativa Indica Group]